MGSLNMCRMCLSVDVRMQTIAGTTLQDIYERITMKMLQNGDEKPVMACYICYHMLMKCSTFIERSRKADEYLQKILDCGFELTEKSLNLINAPFLRPCLVVSSEYTLEFLEPVEPIKKEDIDLKAENDWVSAEVTDEAVSTGDIYQLQYEDPLDSNFETDDSLNKNNINEISQKSLKSKGQNTRTCGTQNEINKDSKTNPGIELILNDKPTSANNLKSIKLKNKSNIRNTKDSIERNKGILPILCLNRNDSVKPIKGSVVKRLQCKYCDKYFGENNLKQHERIHSGDKRYVCHFCGKKFNQGSQLKAHVRVHTGERPYKCTVCDKSFKANGILKYHLTLHTNNKPFCCDHCGKTYAQKRNLYLHITAEHLDMTAKCHLCGKKFNRKGNLKKHMLVHTKDRLFKCELCGKGFSLNYSLKRHLWSHNGFKAYSCEFCNKSFTVKSNLKQHILTHSGVKDFRCSVCDRAYNRRDYLAKHLLTHGKFDGKS